MAKESTIKDHAEEELNEEGWLTYVPVNSRYGSGITRWEEDYKRGNDVFNIWDLIAWRDGELLLIQYTAADKVASRRRKIEEFLEEHDLELPCRAAVWGYKDRQGFTRKVELSQ